MKIEFSVEELFLVEQALAQYGSICVQDGKNLIASGNGSDVGMQILQEGAQLIKMADRVAAVLNNRPVEEKNKGEKLGKTKVWDPNCPTNW